MQIQIKHRYTNAVLHEGDYASILEALHGAIKTGANLMGANLMGADLMGAYLTSANLMGADLMGADLMGANLMGANLMGANLTSAYLTSANLMGANLMGANLTSAYLTSANLTSAYLTGALGAELAIARTRILPEGDLIGWKKCRDGVIVKLKIPSEARRSHAFGRKCRAEFVETLEIFGAPCAVSNHGNRTEYVIGKRTHCDKWSDDWQQECAGGIHFFITRLEAEAY